MSQQSLEQFISQRNGGAWDFDGKYGAQCVDLFNYYNRDVIGAGFIATPITGGARDLFEVGSPIVDENYIKMSANTTLQKGDVIVFGDGVGVMKENGKNVSYGHVTIYIGDNKVIQQNKGFNMKTTIDAAYTNKAIGILRPRKFAAATQSTPAPQPSSDTHTIKQGETFWQLEKDWGMPTGHLSTLNPGVDPKKLQIGQQIKIRGDAAPQQNAQPKTYNIKKGDTLWDLENAWQLPHGRLQELNPGIVPRQLQIGQEIKIG